MGDSAREPGIPGVETDRDTANLYRALADRRRWWVLTGAGISVASGIPAYRDAAGDWLHSKPVQHQDFVKSAAVRQRYWSRSVAGWSRVGSAQPNPAHTALAALETSGHVHQLVTQNVDGLHTRAGSRNVIDLHGRLDTVVCLGCDHRTERTDFQRVLLEWNPGFARPAKSHRPDGDAVLAPGQEKDFRVPPCGVCHGVLMPDVVFFGGQVPKARVEEAYRGLERAEAVLVIGSSLSVYSGFRFVRRAVELKIPLFAVNPGVMRGQEFFQCVTDLPSERFLPDLADCLDSTGPNELRRPEKKG